MYYDNYLNSLKRNIVEVSKAVKGGVHLSRLEYFDFLFKKELAIIEGLRRDRGFLNKLINNISDSDFRLAHFYAKGFSDIVNTIENGYSVKGVSKQFKSYIRAAESKYLCSQVVAVNVSDLNGRITVIIATETLEKTFFINNINDYVDVAIYLLSLLGSLDEDDNGYKDWFNSYLGKEFTKVKEGYKSEIFIERVSIAKDLKSYIIDDVKEKSVHSKNGKVIHLVK